MLNTKQEWGLHLPDARSIYKQGLEKEVKSGKMFKTQNLGAYMSGGKVSARGYKNKDRSIALFFGIWAHDAHQFFDSFVGLPFEIELRHLFWSNRVRVSMARAYIPTDCY